MSPIVRPASASAIATLACVAGLAVGAGTATAAPKPLRHVGSAAAATTTKPSTGRTKAPARAADPRAAAKALARQIQRTDPADLPALVDRVGVAAFRQAVGTMPPPQFLVFIDAIRRQMAEAKIPFIGDMLDQILRYAIEAVAYDLEVASPTGSSIYAK